MYFFGFEHKSAIWDGTLHIKPSLYVCRRAQGSQIFKQNLNSFTFYRVFMIWASSAPGGGAGEWWISVVIRVSLYEFRSVQK